MSQLRFRSIPYRGGVRFTLDEQTPWKVQRILPTGIAIPPPDATEFPGTEYVQLQYWHRIGLRLHRQPILLVRRRQYLSPVAPAPVTVTKRRFGGVF